MKRLLLTGGTGLLGLNWAFLARNEWDVVLALHERKVVFPGTRSEVFTLADKGLADEQISNLAPDLIVHCVGLSNVDQCEKNPELAQFTNAHLAENVAKIAEKHRIKLVHISTDHLFDGQASNYDERAAIHPLNEYARTKAEAEKLVLEANPDALVLRTNFFGWGPPGRISFSDWIIARLRSNESIGVFTDVFFTPISIRALAVAAHELANSGASGIYNAVGEERLSKHSFALQIADVFGLNSDLLRPCSVMDVSLSARRPRDMSLSNERLVKQIGHKIGIVRDFVGSLREEEVELLAEMATVGKSS